MRRGAARLGAVAAVVITACWLAALAAGERQGPPNFKVTASGPVGFLPDEPECPGGAVVTATATPTSGTHLGGKATLDARECATPDFVAGVNHIVGHGTFTSTDGATISFDYGGMSPLPDFATGAINEQLEFTITGGTGRFAGASGGGTLRTHGNFFVSVTGEYDGTIQLHG